MTEDAVPVKPAQCTACHGELHLFMSAGMDHEGKRFQTPMYYPCKTCLRRAHMKGMAYGISAVVEWEEDPF